MTVAELIAKLQEMPQDAEVLAFGNGVSMCPPEPAYFDAEEAKELDPAPIRIPTGPVVLL